MGTSRYSLGSTFLFPSRFVPAIASWGQCSCAPSPGCPIAHGSLAPAGAWSSVPALSWPPSLMQVAAAPFISLAHFARAPSGAALPSCVDAARRIAQRRWYRQRSSTAQRAPYSGAVGARLSLSRRECFTAWATEAERQSQGVAPGDEAEWTTNQGRLSPAFRSSALAEPARPGIAVVCNRISASLVLALLPFSSAAYATEDHRRKPAIADPVAEYAAKYYLPLSAAHNAARPAPPPALSLFSPLLSSTSPQPRGSLR